MDTYQQTTKKQSEEIHREILILYWLSLTAFNQQIWKITTKIFSKKLHHLMIFEDFASTNLSDDRQLERGDGWGVIWAGCVPLGILCGWI